VNVVPEPEDKTVIISARITPDQQYQWDVFMQFLYDVAAAPQYLNLNLRVG